MRELLTPPERWTKGAYARDSKGRIIFGDDKKAVCFCTIGAHQHVLGDGDSWYSDDVDSMFERIGIQIVSEWNDDPSTTHADILAKLDEAIAVARAEGL